MIDPTVRAATDGDVAQLQLLQAEARASLAGQRGGGRWLETHPQRGGDEWTRSVEQGDVVVAHVGDVVVGYLVLTGEAGVATIDEIYVTPEARQLGFGDALVELAIDAARGAGCRAIEGTALPGDRDTKNLFERAGITARLIVVAKQL